MRFFLMIAVLLGTVSAWIGASAVGSAQTDKPVSAADWLPEQTQGFARIVDFPKFLERWKKTQLGILADDPRLKDFWQEQQKTIESRFSEAGWQLNLSAEDVSKIASGQAAVGWISKPQDPQKPYAVTLIVDVSGKKEEVTSLLEKVDQELTSRKATSQPIEFKGHTITKYTLPRGPGELVIRESLYAIVDDFLLAADELPALQQLIDARQSGNATSLAKSDLYKKATSRLPNQEVEQDIEYFIRPIGLAKLLRSISGKPVTTQTDVLKVLENQGFGKIAAACGQLRFTQEKFDVAHDAFVFLDLPIPTSVQVLDFPNLAGKTIPHWVSPKAATFLAVAWNAQDAFWKVESIVDELAGQEGVFESVIEGIQTDPLGPQIDIRKDVLPFVTSEIYSISEIVEPITTDSRHSLIAIRIEDPNGKLAGVLDRAMKNEPDASPEDFEEYRIWKVTRPEDGDEAFNGGDFEFGNKKSSKSAKPPEEDEPLLSNWAITIFSEPMKDGEKGNQYLMFASHAEMIKEAILASKRDKGEAVLDKQGDVLRVLGEIQPEAGALPYSLWQVNRSDLAFRMQYELFRQDKLPQSRSMLATILDRILRPKDELKPLDQRVKGDKLPPYDAIREFFMPGGSSVHTHADGWSFRGFILGK